MRFPIDVVMLDKDDRVLGIRRNLRPWRAYVCQRGTTSVIETAVDVLGVEIGVGLKVSEIEVDP
ncbi:MAG: hypothetical protein WD070_10195 [Pirellulaceae bacterium]